MSNLFRHSEQWWPHLDLLKFMRDRGIAIDYRHEEAAEEFFAGKILLKYTKNPPQHWGWRVTLPLWLCYWSILVVIVAPINWLITGHYSIEHNTKIYAFTKTWHNKIFP